MTEAAVNKLNLLEQYLDILSGVGTQRFVMLDSKRKTLIGIYFPYSVFKLSWKMGSGFGVAAENLLLMDSQVGTQNTNVHRGLVGEATAL